MSTFVDISGKRFGNLVAIEREQDVVQPNGRRNGRRRVVYKCRCDCGNIVTVRADHLRSGATKSCGCMQRELLSSRQTTHGQSKTHLYGVWNSMKSRCYNSATQFFYRYGGRGITVCDEWRNDFESFRSWSEATGYRDGMTLDRKDNDLGYSSDNCRWTDRVTQANNRSSNRMLTLDGETHNVTEWAAIIGADPRKLFNRVYAGWSDAEILKR